MGYKLVIFDCDGTLIDTVSDVAECFDEALKRCGFAPCGEDAVARLVGNPLETIVRELLGLSLAVGSDQVDDEAVKAVVRAYRMAYDAHPKNNTKPFDGISSLVADLVDAGIAVGINSNKPEGPLGGLIQRHFPDEGILVAGYTSERPPKPSPDGALALCQMTGIRPADAAYVGDTIIDFETAKTAGMDCLIVSWGQGSAEFYGSVESGTLCKSIEDLRNRLDCAEA